MAGNYTLTIIKPDAFGAAKAGQILSEASDRALALCSLDGGRCRQCGNPRTGRYCPKCGGAGEGTGGGGGGDSSNVRVEEEAAV